MAYTPTTWVEGVTTVGPTNLNHLETGLQTAAAVADSASTLATAALPTPAGSNGQFLKRVAGVWVPTTFAASDIPSFPSSATTYLAGDGTWPSLAYTTYAPTWTSSGTAPAIGNATVVARYAQIGKIVHAYGVIVFGSTSTFGTGTYSFALPVTASTNVSTNNAEIGSSTLFDSSATAIFTGAGVVALSTTTMGIHLGATYLGTLSNVAQTVPWTWAVSDQVKWNITYEAA